MRGHRPAWRFFADLSDTDGTGLSESVRSVEDMTHNAIAEQFFDSYTRALLDRDAETIAEHYAVPALIEFPEHPIAVSSASQTKQFFAEAFGQYEGEHFGRLRQVNHLRSGVQDLR